MMRHLYQDILLEIALSISGELDLDKLLKKCLPLFQRKLNCLFSGVYSETEGALHLEMVLPPAIRSSDGYRWAHAELLRVHAEGNNEPLVVISQDGVHLYLMNLLGFGRLMLCRSTAFDSFFLKELLPLAPMLARACASCREVARRREIEAALEKERHLTTAIIDHAPIGIWLTDYRDRSLLLVNPFMKKEVGLGSDDNRMSHEEMSVCAETDHQAVAAEGPVEYDERITFKDGRQHILKTIKTKIMDDDGSIAAILGIGVDITDAINAQLEAQRQSHLQQLLMEIAATYINLPLDRVDDAINASLCDLAHFVDADRAYIFDYDFTARVSSNLFEWCNSGIQPQINSLQQVPMVEFPDWLHVHLQGKPMYVADVGALPSGGLRNILEPQGIKSLLAVPLMNHEECVGFVGFDSVSDHHHYTKSEQHLLTLFAQMLVNVQLRQKTEQQRQAAEQKVVEMSQTLEIKVRERTAELLEVNEKVRLALAQSTRAEAEATALARQNKLFLQSISEGFYGIDTDGHSTFVNPAAAKMLGFDSTELLGRSIHKLTHHTRSDGTACSEDDCPVHQLVLKQGQTLSKVVDIYWRKDGTCFPVEYHSAPIREGERILGAVVVFTDITERNILEQQLLQARKLEAIGQLAAGIAHEINTPLQYIQNNTTFLQTSVEELSAMLGALQQFRTAAESEDKQQYLDRLIADASACDLDFLLTEIPLSIQESLQGIDHVVRIVSAMKEFSHPGQADKSPTDLNRLIENSTIVTRNEWKYVAELITDLDPALPPLVCDTGSWNQILLNLIVNSAHAIEASQRQDGTLGKIKIATRKQDQYLILSVEDNGVGIAAEHLDRIFEPFFTTKEVGKGTGQGLAIVYDLVVNKHQGNISCDSKPGLGCRFTLIIPLTNSTKPGPIT